ncbi:MAG: RdgB/HAM1 family non-canonical purine NTP pyrophosphatase [Thermotogae bacterium]|nr:RdgB/HAM1 family non-canonical purine NTP pyrophosphatase [Thermotogota bacterium]
MKIYMATSNRHKIEEVNTIFGNFADIKAISDLIENFSPEETGSTFIENSVIKAVTAGNIIKKPVISDDSGLCIESLDYFPGINSARYMEGFTYKEKMESLLEKLKNTDNRKAYFACAATYFDPEKNILISCEEHVNGKIGYEICGENGFGYDPFFIPDGFKNTFGVLPAETKNSLSHRYMAFKKLFELINKIK